jgi:hypothetical protein
MVRRVMAVGGGAANLMHDWASLTTRFDQFKEDTKFLESIRPELQNEYPNCWIAVYEKKVVGTGQKLKDIIQQLDDGNIPKSRAVIDYLRTEPITMIL